MRYRFAHVMLALLFLAPAIAAAQVISNTDGSIQGSLCVGDDCLASETFGDDTLRLKAQALRIHFDDTSSNGAPNADWRILINGLQFGDGSFFAIEDSTTSEVPFKINSLTPNNTIVTTVGTSTGYVGIGTPAPLDNLHILDVISPGIILEERLSAQLTASMWRMTASGFGFQIFDELTARSPMTIRNGAPESAFVIDTDGDIGAGVFTPQTKLHIRDGDSPTLRLEQDTTQAMPAQVWDVGGNEANFFVRDQLTSSLPLRIRPGAPDNALYVAGNGEVGMGIPDPKGALHIRRNQPNNVPHLLLQTRRTNGRAEIWFEDDNTATDNDALRLQLNGDVFNVSFNGTGGAELAITKTGDVRVPRGNLVVPSGGVIVGGQTLNVPDYVFAPDYQLMPLDELRHFIAENSHLPQIPSAEEINSGALNMTDMQMALLKKVEELTLYTLELQAEIEALKAKE